MKRQSWTISFVLLVLAGVFLWVLVGREPPHEGRCRLARRKTDPESQLMELAFQYLRPLDSVPDNVQDCPASFEHPRYYRIKSGDKPILMAADFSQKRVRLCVDTDGDGVLSEERCFTAKLSKETPVSGRRQMLGPISLASGAGKTNDGFYVRCFRNDARGLLIPFAASFRTGKMRLAGKVYRVAAVDGNYDGLFNPGQPLPLDRALTHPGCDLFAIDLNRNGTFETSWSKESEVFPLGKLVRVDDTYYAIDIASDGRSLALPRTEPHFGTLAVEPNDAAVALRLWSDAADQCLQQSQEQQLPVGKYKTLRAILTIRDAAGDIWAFSSTVSSGPSLGQLEHFAIRPGETTSIKIGPPFVVKANVRVHTGRVLISPTIVGRGGEVYGSSVRGGQQRPSPIPFKIVAEDETVLLEDKFEYG